MVAETEESASASAVNADAKQALQQQVDDYFKFKKNLLIQEVVFFNRDVLETPDIICIITAESIYNVHTGRLIVAGGSSQGFYEDIKSRYNIDKTLNVRLSVLVEAIIALKNRDLVEFIPIGKNLGDHIDMMVEESDAKINAFVEKFSTQDATTEH